MSLWNSIIDESKYIIEMIDDSWYVLLYVSMYLIIIRILNLSFR